MPRHAVSSADTTPEADRIMWSRLAALSVTERAQLAAELSDMCTQLAVAGIRAQHGPVEGDELRWHLAARRYGKALADEVYGPRPDR